MLNTSVHRMDGDARSSSGLPIIGTLSGHANGRQETKSLMNTRRIPSHRRRLLFVTPALVAVALIAVPAAELNAQWATTFDQFYLPAEHNWKFRDRYANADRLFNAFDYGHATLYETLWSRPQAPVSKLEVEEYDYLTKRVLVRPPRLPIEEGAIEVGYAKLVPEAKAMFEWAHTFHRQAYDVWADESIPLVEKDARMTELLEYYRSRADLAFSSRPKSMDVMDAHFYSLAFRQRYPKFNGLIWAYHWLQVGLYEPLVVGRSNEQRRALLNATVARFRQMLEMPPASMPYLMPMTPAIAPTFARRYPEAGAIFDNLHMMHDVISDVLVSREVPRSAKRQEILRAAELFRSDTAYAISYEAWLGMGEMMGVNNMGGPAVGFTAALPTPTVARGASMAGMHGGAAATGAGAMPGMQHGGAAGMPGMATNSAPEALTAIVQRMLADPVIRERVATDPALQRMISSLPAGTLANQSMPGMQNMPAMPGNVPAAGGMTMGAGVPMNEEHRQAIEFLVRLFSDPAVEARIHADPELHRLWSDPDVQRRLTELRSARPAPSAVPAPARPAPATPAPAQHNHP